MTRFKANRIERALLQTFGALSFSGPGCLDLGSFPLIFIRHNLLDFRSPRRMVRIGLRSHAFHFRNSDHRQESYEQKETGKKEAKRANVSADVNRGRLIVTPA